MFEQIITNIIVAVAVLAVLFLLLKKPIADNLKKISEENLKFLEERNKKIFIEWQLC